MQSHLLALDGGTQSTKVSIFDLEGNEICSQTVRLRPLHLSDGGKAEHPDDDLWTSLQKACKVLFETFQGDPNSIVGVGLGSIRCCRALLTEDGSLASPVQNWMDARLASPYEHENDAVRYVTTATGYLTHRLTGETKDTRANYVGPWPIDPETLEWYDDPQQFAAYTTPRSMLFQLVDPSTVLGTVTAEASKATGIPEGIPVVSTANDKAVEGLGSGLVNDGTVLVSLGTYITSMMVGDSYRADTTSYWSNPGAVPGQFIYESDGIRRGMSTVTWIKELMGKELVDEAKKRNMGAEAYLNELAAQVPAGSDGLYTVLHWLPRPSVPHERGMMVGFDGRHKGPHMFRSVLEGIALTMKRNVQAMCEERGIPTSRLIISGGGSNGDLFMQIFADVFGLPARRNVVNGSASLGAAICTSLALGIYGDRKEAIEMMVKEKDSFAPIEAHTALYDRIDHDVYRHLAPTMDPLFATSHRIFNG